MLVHTEGVPLTRGQSCRGLPGSLVKRQQGRGACSSYLCPVSRPPPYVFLDAVAFVF